MINTSSKAMGEKYPDEKYIMAKARLQERDRLNSEVSKISFQIAELTRLRDATRTEARRLKSAAIAYEIGVSKSWVEKVSDGRVVR